MGIEETQKVLDMLKIPYNPILSKEDVTRILGRVGEIKAEHQALKEKVAKLKAE